jgi:hypothetical protein
MPSLLLSIKLPAEDKPEESQPSRPPNEIAVEQEDDLLDEARVREELGPADTRRLQEAVYDLVPDPQGQLGIGNAHQQRRHRRATEVRWVRPAEDVEQGESWRPSPPVDAIDPVLLE